MAITTSAKKAIRSSARKRVFNLRRSRAMKSIVKDFRDLVTSSKLDEAKTLLPNVYKAIDKASKRGVIKTNTASRKKSRLTKLLKNKKS